MSRLRFAAAWVLGLLAGATGCRIEDRTPTGSRRDEETIQGLVSLYARDLSNRDWAGLRALFWNEGSYAGTIAPGAPGGGAAAVPIDSALQALKRTLQGSAPDEYDVRLLRADLRQQGDLAAVWVTARRRVPAAGGPQERDWVEHLLLRRIDGEWRILSVAAVPWQARR